MKTTVAVISDVGRARTNNEDNFVVMQWMNDDFNHRIQRSLTVKDRLHVYGVFDGMGGQSDGEVAAITAARGFQTAAKTMNDCDYSVWLTQVQQKLNQDVCEIARHTKKRLGSTSTLLLLAGDVAHLNHLGDSRCYLYRDNHFELVSTDHLYQSKVNSTSGKGKLAQYLGVFEYEHILEPQSISFPVTPGDIILLCSDGVSDLVDREQLERIIQLGHSPQDIAEELVNQCLVQGAPDNCTAIVIRIEKSSIIEKYLLRFC